MGSKDMHDTAMENGRRFFDTYARRRTGLTIVDIGALDVSGSLRSVAPPDQRYVGLDFAAGKGVDVVVDDPYSMPLADESVDIIVSTSCFEHSEFFWLLFNDLQRILKPDGICYLNVPSNGYFHRFPVDCWRFYPDAGVALQNWARRSGYRTTLLESFIGGQGRETWNDFVAVFLKDSRFIESYPDRIQNSLAGFTNGLVYGGTDFVNYSKKTEDQRKRYRRFIPKFLRF